VTELAGFWSYAHVDDEADGGRVSRLVHRGLVSNTVTWRAENCTWLSRRRSRATQVLSKRGRTRPEKTWLSRPFRRSTGGNPRMERGVSQANG
jgi:hypothetical protein